MRKPLIPSAIARNIEIGKHSAAVLVIAMVFAACATAVYAAGPTRSFQLGLWSGGAYTNDQTGAFSHCGANVPYKSGITMFVVINRSYAWSLGFASQQWNLVPKAQIPIEIHFDGGQGFDVVGTVLTPILLEVPMPANSNLINTFRYALRMAATAQGQSFLFDLTNTSKLMVQLAACVQTSLALEFGQPPGTTAAPALPAVVASPS
jgi:hypothetical protein